ncbi:MAG TPA: outer membrane protein transport protein [Dissulfurispiraceae bacterium]|nr:outer membrane protein transport protein [Dissulfurispiraceae bacterium]
MKKVRIASLAFGAALLMKLGAADCYASGFGIFTQDSASTSQASATIAHADGPSAVFFNPALINQLPGTQISIGTTLIIPSRQFTSALTGQTTKTERQTFFPSNIYLTHAVNDKFSVGFGIFNPFGLSTKWPTDWEGRYLATNSELTTWAFNPVASVKVAPWLTAAAGVVFLRVDSTLERQMNFSFLGDGSQKFKGSGDGIGFNAGILIDPVKDISIGLSYRSRIRTVLDGNASFDLPAAASFLSPLFQNTHGQTKIDLPAQAYIGVHFRQLYPFTFEIAGRWEQWSSFKELNLQFSQPVAGSMSAVTPRNWRDTWTSMIGMKYQLCDTLALMGGYLYQRAAVPDSTFEPAIPDADSHLFTSGISYKPFKAFSLDAGYGFQKLLSRTKNNAIDDDLTDGVFNAATAANAVYKSKLHLFSLNLSYRF